MKIFEIKWNNMITEEKTIHADFGKYQGDLVGNKTIWLYPTKGAYDFKDQIKKLEINLSSFEHSMHPY